MSSSSFLFGLLSILLCIFIQIVEKPQSLSVLMRYSNHPTKFFSFNFRLCPSASVFINLRFQGNNTNETPLKAHRVPLSSNTYPGIKCQTLSFQ
jgi:hypothetical protein